MNFEVALMLLLVVATMTGLVTEAVKKVLQEGNVSYKPNLLAGLVAVALSVGVGAAYMVLTETVLNAQMAVYLIALVFLSWLSAMVGYDKVVQTIAQLRK